MTCPKCYTLSKPLEGRQTSWTCPVCGYVVDQLFIGAGRGYYFSSDMELEFYKKVILRGIRENTFSHENLLLPGFQYPFQQTKPGCDFLVYYPSPDKDSVKAAWVEFNGAIGNWISITFYEALRFTEYRNFANVCSIFLTMCVQITKKERSITCYALTVDFFKLLFEKYDKYIIVSPQKIQRRYSDGTIHVYVYVTYKFNTLVFNECPELKVYIMPGGYARFLFEEKILYDRAFATFYVMLRDAVPKYMDTLKRWKK